MTIPRLAISSPKRSSSTASSGTNAKPLSLQALLGFAEWSQGNPATARAHFEAGVALGRKLGDKQLLATSLSGLGTLFSAEGDHAQARALKEESLAAYQQAGDKWVVGLINWSLSKVAIAQGDLDAARAFLTESAAIGEELGNEWSVPYVLEGFGEVALAEHAAERAARLYGAAAVLRERLGLTVPPGERAAHDQVLARMRAKLTPESLASFWAAGRALSPEEALGLAAESHT